MIGQTLKHYEVEESLGRGGMGVVYKARDSRLGRHVALKLLPEEFTSDPDRRRRFLQEARAACKVNHPAIAQVYDVDEVEGRVFIAMELVDGKSVRSLLQGRELDLLGALEVAIQVGSGLAKAHEAGIVHRDIKPENVMVTPDGHAKVLDFGLAKLTQPETDSGPKPSADDLSAMETVARTQAGMVMGTLRYMSPEQARGQTIDHRSDVFSLGVVLYEMVTGQLPFSGNTPVDTLHAIAFEETRPVTALRANLPPSLQRVISRCLRKRPQDRYPDAKGMVDDLKAVQREVESGISQKIPFKQMLQERLRGLKELSPSEWAWPIALGVALLGFLVFLFWKEDAGPGLPITLGIVGLFVYRRFRNRRYRLTRRIVTRIKRLPEVRFVTAQRQCLTVVADQALAKTYVRVTAAVDLINSKMFFGEPFSVVVRDGLTPEEERALLSGSGVLYVRPDAMLAGTKTLPPS
jgi:tRNA A-37 threonylcarbamoyl transferase component Bud32